MTRETVYFIRSRNAPSRADKTNRDPAANRR